MLTGVSGQPSYKEVPIEAPLAGGSIVLMIILWTRRMELVLALLSTFVAIMKKIKTIGGLFNRKEEELGMAEVIGTKELLEVIDLGLALGNGVFQSLKNDGKIDVADVPLFLPALMAVPAAIDGAGLIGVEFKALDASKLEAVKAHILAKMPEIGEKWIVVGAESFNIAVSAFKIYSAFKPAA